uniref:SH2 domain-containing protein 4B n=1 Tax=Ascaris suum TaxID=6253 RepID=F1KVR0_ASCSU
MTELEDNSRPCLYPNEDESTLKQQLSRMGMHMNDTSVDGKVAHKAAAAAAGLSDVSKLRTALPKLEGELLQRSIPSDSSTLTIGTPATLVVNTNLSTIEPSRTRGVPVTQPASINHVPSRDAEPVPGGSAISGLAGDSVQASGVVPLPQTKAFPLPVGQLPSASNALTSHSWEQRSATLPARVNFMATPCNVRMRTNAGTRPSLTDEDITKRQSEIFEMMKEKHKKIVKEAEIEAERVKFAWEEQERKAREAEAQIRQIAQKAREQHRQQSLRTSTSILPALKDTKASSLREAIRNLPRPPKPKSRQAIVDWFRIEELARGTGLDPKTHMPAPWFHGIISRDQADALLKGKPAGSFLVRVSERIWGYTVSYVVGEGSPKHFLIERIPQGYQFLGTNQVVHKQLYDLITYHETAPITFKGNEILKWPVGQNCSPPDYADLIFETNALPGGTHANTLPASFYRRF